MTPWRTLVQAAANAGCEPEVTAAMPSIPGIVFAHKLATFLRNP
jgi:hypothetical protein